MAKHLNRIPQPERPERVYRFRGHMSPQEAEQAGVRAEVTATKNGDTAVIRLYDVIDSFGGFWGISANEIIEALDELGEVKTIQVRINSPGGDAFEGIAIYNALVSHPAEVNVVVDRLAASAASIVAMAGDTIEMMTGSQMMIHDAWGFCIGNADDMTKMGNSLDHMSDNLASVYAERAGGSQADWRAAMKEETWYSAKEAVDAGLATKVTKSSPKKDDNTSKAHFDLSIFNFAGRDAAPAPVLDTKNHSERASVAASSKQGQENNRMTADQLQAMGLPEDASDDEITARIAQLVKNETPDPSTTDPTPDGTGEPNGNAQGDEDPEAKPGDDGAPSAKPDEPSVDAKLALPDNVVVVDKEQWQNVTNRLGTMEARDAKREEDDAIASRKAILDSAIQAGKFAPAQRKYYEDLLTQAPAQATALINSLAPNTVPLNEIGRGDVETGDDQDVYPTQFLTRSEKERIAALRGA